MTAAYVPPFAVTPAIVDAVAQISERIGRLGLGTGGLRLRRSNRIRTCRAIERSTEQASATPFVELMLGLIRTALDTQPEQASAPGPHTEQFTEQVLRLVQGLGQDTCSARSLMARLGLRHRPSFAQDCLHPALAAGLVAMTDPDHPRSPRQVYRLTEAGRRLLEQHWPEHSKGGEPRP